MSADKMDKTQEGAAEEVAPEAVEDAVPEAVEPEMKDSEAGKDAEPAAERDQTDDIAAEGDAAEAGADVADDAGATAEGDATEADADAPDDAKGADAPNIFEAITAEVTELRDKYARLQAEWDNFRKRTAAERKSERDRAAESLVTDLLPVLDDLERAINHARESGEGGTLTDGVEAIQSKFLQILGKHKVEQLSAQGEAFDATRHQAVGVEEDDSVPEETVVRVYQQGYTMGDRVIRPAMVVTSTGGPERKTEEPEEA